MSGGHWNYEDQKLNDLVEALYADLKMRLQEMPSDFTEPELQKIFYVSTTALRTLSLSALYMRRLDYLLSYDDSFATFEERLKDDLTEGFKTWIARHSDLTALLANRKKLAEEREKRLNKETH